MKLNILELCLSPDCGGLELYVNKIAKYFSTHEKIKTIAVVKKNSLLNQKLDDSTVKCHYLHVINRHFPIVAGFKLAALINREKINVIHVHWGKDLFLAVLAKILSKKALHIVYMRQMALTRKKNDFYHRFLYKRIDAYLVITKILYHDAIKFLPIPKENVHLLYYGVPEGIVNFQCDQYLQEKGVDPDTFKVAIFGRIEAPKGQYLVIQAVKNIFLNGQNISLSIIGHAMDAGYLSKLENIIDKEGAKQYIHFHGFHDRPTNIMPCFDAIVLATRCETFGLVLPEAMRAGVAVIGTNCGGVPEIISHGKTGLLFEPGDANGLEGALNKLISNQRYCYDLAKQGKEFADKQFSETQHVKTLKKILSKFEK